MYIIKDNKEKYFVDILDRCPVFSDDYSQGKVLTESDASDLLKTLKKFGKTKCRKVLYNEPNADLQQEGKYISSPEVCCVRIEELIESYKGKAKAKDIYDIESRLICKRIVHDLEEILYG